MAVTAFWYGQVFLGIFNEEIDWINDTIKVALCTNAYTPSQDTHVYFDSITNEASGTGYTAGGATLTNKVKSYNQTTNIMAIDADDVTWSSSTITARYAILYDDTPVADADKPLLGYIDFGVDFSSDDGDFTITWNSAGIARVTIS